MKKKKKLDESKCPKCKAKGKHDGYSSAYLCPKCGFRWAYI